MITFNLVQILRINAQPWCKYCVCHLINKMIGHNQALVFTYNYIHILFFKKCHILSLLTVRLNSRVLTENISLEVKVEFTIMCCWCLSCWCDCFSLGTGSSFNSTIITHGAVSMCFQSSSPGLCCGLPSCLSVLYFSRSMMYTDQYQHVSVSVGSSHGEFSPAV